MMENFRLRVFRAVARHLSFSRAAEELLLTQPAVTQQIKALESELGASLFLRAGGSIQLTPGGRALLPFAEQIRALSEEAVQAVAAAQGEQSGTLELGASQTIAQYVLPALLAEFHARHPRVESRVHSGNTDAMLEALLAGRVQIALIEGPDGRKDLHIEPFLEDRMVLVVPAGHKWANGRVTPDQLRAEPLVVREFGSGSRRVVEQALQEGGLRPRDLHIRMEFDSTEALLSAVEAGLGVTFVSRWAVRNQLALGTLQLAHVSGLKLSRWFSVATPAGPEPRGNAGAFRAQLLSIQCRTILKDRFAQRGPGSWKRP